MLNELTIMYLFLGGDGAGATLVLTLISWLFTRGGLRRMDVECVHFAPIQGERRLFGFGYAAAAGLQLLGILCLLLDMGRPDKALTLFLNPHFSITAVGAYGLGAVIVLSAALAVVWLHNSFVRRWLVRVLGLCAMLAAAVVMAYTALLLQAFAGVEFWDSSWLIVLFFLSSASTGIAVVVAVSVVARVDMHWPGLVRRLFAIDMFVILFEALALVAYLMTSWPVAAGDVETLLTGGLAELFWGGFVLCGLVVPVVLNAGTRLLPGLRVHPGVICACVLIGGFCLRWCVVMAPQ